MSVSDQDWPLLRHGAGPVSLALLHGFLGSSKEWRELLTALPRGMTALAFDLPGHGRAASRQDIPTWAETLSELDRQRQDLGLNSWHLVGYSLGGRVALHYALAYPERVASLTLLSTSPGLEDPVARQERRQADASWGKRFGHEPMAKILPGWYAQGVFTSLQRRPQLLAEMLARRDDHPPGLLAEILNGWGQGQVPAVWERLGELAAIPKQLLVGREDVRYCQLAETIRQGWSDWQVIVVEECGHTLHLEQPKQVAHCVASLLAPPTTTTKQGEQCTK